MHIATDQLHEPQVASNRICLAPNDKENRLSVGETSTFAFKHDAQALTTEPCLSMAGAKEEPEPVNEENVTWPPALKDDEADGISEKPTGCSVADSTIDDLAKFLPADISLDLPMQPTTWEQYQEYLQIEDVMNVQLSVVGATEEDLEAFPARTSVLETLQHFPFFKAGCRFRGSLCPQSESRKIGAYIPVKVNFECSQASLDAIVQSMYSQKLHLEVHNCAEILGVADYLQATWLIEGIMRHIKSVLLPAEPIVVLKLGQRFHDDDLSRSSIELAQKADLTGISTFMKHIEDSSICLQKCLLEIVCQHQPLQQVLELGAKNAEEGSWKLIRAHLETLNAAYPQHSDILEHLSGEGDDTLPIDMGRIQLAIMLLSKIERIEDSQYKYRLDYVVSAEELRGKNPLHSRSLGPLRVWLQWKYGRWSVFVYHKEPWTAANVGRISCINHNSDEQSTYRFIDPSKGYFVGSRRSHGFRNLVSHWLEGRHFSSKQPNPDALTIVLEMKSLAS